MGKLHLIKNIALSCLCLAVVIAGHKPANAQAIDYTPTLPGTPTDGEISGCATDTWSAMVNQAVMETRRQDIFNKRYIVKSDSILQYACFRDPLRHFAWDIPRIFSNGDQWANKEVDILAPENIFVKIYQKDYPEVEENYNMDSWISPSLEEAITLMIDEAMVAYIEGHFDHDLISGTTGLGKSYQSICVSMDQMWQSAKCKNFDEKNVFLTFEELMYFEPRQFPSNMPCVP